MSKIEIQGNELEEVIEAAETMKKGIGDTLTKAKSLKAKVEATEWTGKNKKAFVAYLDLIYQYHEDLNKAMKAQKTAVKNLKSNISSFDNLSEPSKVRSL
ncbi:WXG100 family type VII secretion target [Enterococcus sp. LJL128]